MTLWRISNYADLLGMGGMQASARWHTAGQPVVYLAENPSSALLEILVHLELDDVHRPDTYQLLKIQAPDDLLHEEIPSSMPESWQHDELETQAIGDAWLARGETALLRVPSAIVPETWNWVLNPRHAQARQLTIVRVERYPYDGRLFPK